MEGADSGSAPASGEVVQIDAAAVGAIEEGPKPVGTEGRFEPDIGERVEKVGETFVATLTGRDGDPQDGAGAQPETGRHGSVGPALDGKDLAGPGDLKVREFQTLFPDYGQVGTVDIGEG